MIRAGARKGAISSDPKAGRVIRACAEGGCSRRWFRWPTRVDPRVRGRGRPQWGVIRACAEGGSRGSQGSSGRVIRACAEGGLSTACRGRPGSGTPRGRGRRVLRVCAEGPRRRSMPSRCGQLGRGVALCLLAWRTARCSRPVMRECVEGVGGPLDALVPPACLYASLGGLSPARIRMCVFDCSTRFGFVPFRWSARLAGWPGSARGSTGVQQSSAGCRWRRPVVRAPALGPR